MRDKIKLPWVISSWKSERKLWLKFHLNRSIFLFLCLKSVIGNFGFLNLFLYIWIRNPDSEYGSRLKLNADPTGSGTLQDTQGRTARTWLPSGSRLQNQVQFYASKGGESADSRLFSSALGAFAFFAPFFVALPPNSGFALASAKARTPISVIVHQQNKTKGDKIFSVQNTTIIRGLI